MVFETRLGAVEIPDEAVVTFPLGLPGFEERRRFAFLQPRGWAPLALLQSLEEPGLGLPVVDPFAVRPDYTVDVPEAAARLIGLSDPADAALWAVVVLPEDLAQATVNLLAPLVVNARQRLACQVVAEESPFGVREPLFPLRGVPAAPSAAPRAGATATASALPSEPVRGDRRQPGFLVVPLPV